MKVDEKFNMHRKGYKTLECECSTSMNLAPANNFSFSREEERITLRFRNGDDDKTLVIRMSRKEAKRIGAILTDYSSRILDHEKIESEGEKVLTSPVTPATVEK